MKSDISFILFHVPNLQGGRFDRDRDYRGGGFRDRGPPGGPGYGPPEDSRGDIHGRGA